MSSETRTIRPYRGVDHFQGVLDRFGQIQPKVLISADGYRYTNRGNLVAVVSNGTAVLGLGDIGALAGKPVMEGKALLFKEFAGIDGFPVCLRTASADEIALLDEGRAEEALTTLDGAGEITGFEARYAEVRGDILFALGRTDEAVTAYREALDALLDRVDLDAVHPG